MIEKVGLVAYRLALPHDLEKIHNLFHVSMLRRYLSDPSHVVSTETIELRPDLTYEEEPVEMLAREVKELRNKKILLVKVLWRNHKTEEATWESEETMRQQYPQLFNYGKFRGRNVLKEEGFVTPRPERVYSTCNRRVAFVHQKIFLCRCSIVGSCY